MLDLIKFLADTVVTTVLNQSNLTTALEFNAEAKQI